MGKVDGLPSEGMGVFYLSKLSDASVQIIKRETGRGALIY